MSQAQNRCVLFIKERLSLVATFRKRFEGYGRMLMIAGALEPRRPLSLLQLLGEELGAFALQPGSGVRVTPLVKAPSGLDALPEGPQ